jgi:hypothetical protein
MPSPSTTVVHVYLASHEPKHTDLLETLLSQLRLPENLKLQKHFFDPSSPSIPREHRPAILFGLLLNITAIDPTHEKASEIWATTGTCACIHFCLIQSVLGRSVVLMAFSGTSRGKQASYMDTDSYRVHPDDDPYVYANFHGVRHLLRGRADMIPPWRWTDQDLPPGFLTQRGLADRMTSLLVEASKHKE